MTVTNSSGKDPNQLHDKLCSLYLEPILFQHNRVYDAFGNMVSEATEFTIEPMAGKEIDTQNAVDSFMSL